MILISHRGNIEGRLEDLENNPIYIDKAIKEGYEVEVDVRNIDGILYLGHDRPQYRVDFVWFTDRINKLWVHCKNIEAILYFKYCKFEINYFWHEGDTLTLTSKNYMWVYPGKQPIRDSIAVMPEIHNDDVSECLGVCSNNIKKYK